MKIALATADWSRSVQDEDGNPAWGGSGWARLGQYHGRLPHETIAGILISKGDVFGVRDHEGNHHFDCDLIWMQRFMFGDIADRMGKAKANGQILINDLDDWYWGMSTTNNAWQSSHPKENSIENINFYKSIIARSTAVHVSTPYLAQRIKEWCRAPIHVVHNYVDFDRFPVQREHTSDQPVIGWVGSTSHRSRDLETLRGLLKEYERKGLTFHHSGHYEGAQSFAEAVGVSDESVSKYPLVAHAEYPYVFLFDIGIVPLNDTPFNEAKSYIKGLEYVAAGVPFIASRVGEYVSLTNEGIGRICKHGKHWNNHIDALMDPAVRAEEAKRNLSLAEPHDIRHGIALLTTMLESYAT